jgi:subtilisin family serine protease
MITFTLNMKKTLHLIICFFVSFSVFSQEDAWVYFNAKPNATFYYNTPLEMLSQRALDRRTNQNIVIDFKDIPIEPSYITQIKAATGIVVMAKSKWLNALHIRGNQAAIEALKLLSFVEKVDFANKMLNQAGKKTIVNKVKKANKKLETQVNYAYGNSANQILMFNGQTMHQQNYTGSGKIIAVMDAGFPGVNVALPFQRLRDNNQILGGYDFVLRNTDFYTGSSHGTSVLSTMGGYKENFLVGTAPDASYYLFITEDDTTENPVEESLWVEAAEKADSLGVDVINTSLGYSDEHTNPAYDYSYSDMNGATTFISKGAEIAFSRGMIIVASAGNSGGSANPYISAPADAISIIAVGAVNASKNLASYSSIGPSFDGRIKPDLMAQGSATVLSNESGDIVTSSGTSFSSPIMAGMIACLWQAFPEKTNQEIKQLLFESSDKFAMPNYQFGYGIPDFALAITNGLALHQFEENDFKIYPNPTNDTLFISFPKDFNQGTLFIYTIFGQKVLEQKISSQVTTLSLKALNQGMYVYKLESNGYSKTGKIIKR